MDTAMIGTVGSANASSGMAGVGVAGLRSDDFMKVLIAQLRYQDPFEPMGNEELLRQVATIRELEMNSQLTGRIRQLAERYETPLPQLTARVADLSTRVDEHLVKMGAV